MLKQKLIIIAGSPCVLTKETESHMLDYVINYCKGIYYIYGKPLNQLPEVFQSLETSRYLAAIDILSGYELARGKLNFVVEWLEKNMDETGGWDLGTKARDNVYFPLSDSWRTAEIRKADYIEKILSIIFHAFQYVREVNYDSYYRSKCFFDSNYTITSHNLRITVR